MDPSFLLLSSFQKLSLPSFPTSFIFQCPILSFLLLLEMYNFITYYVAFETSGWFLFTLIQFLSGLKFEKKNCLPYFISPFNWNENIMRTLKTCLLKYEFHLTDNGDYKRSKDNNIWYLGGKIGSLLTMLGTVPILSYHDDCLVSRVWTYMLARN